MTSSSQTKAMPVDTEFVRLVAREAAESATSAHEKLCAERYTAIRNDIKFLRDTMRTAVKWALGASGALVLAVIGALNWLVSHSVEIHFH